MKKITLSVFSLALLALSCNNAENKTEATTTDSTTTATAAAPAEATPPMDSAAQMKAYMDYATPGDVHKMIATWDGKWKSDVTSWWGGPDKPPATSTGTSENKMILNGLYQSSTFNGNMNGMPFEGHSTLAYDNHKKIFMSTWIDNMGSGITYMEGPWDEATKTITLKGKMTDVASGKDCEMRQTMKVVDDKTQVMEMYMTSPGQKEMKVMEMKNTKM